MFPKAIKDLGMGISLWHVWFYQAYHEISAKYKRTVLGSLWIAGSMAFTSLSFTIVFGALFGGNIRDLLPYMMSGLMCWGCISHVLTEAPEVYMGNAGIISNHAYPFSYYNLEAVAKNLMTFFHNIVVYLILSICLSRFHIPHWTFVFGFVVIFINMFCWGSLVSMICARYRDMRFLLPYLATLIQFSTPIMYHAEQIKTNHALLVDFNPFYPFVEMLRAPLQGRSMGVELWPMAGVITVLGALFWLFFFNANRKRIPFWV